MGISEGVSVGTGGGIAPDRNGGIVELERYLVIAALQTAV